MAIEKQNLLSERTQDAYPRIRPSDEPGAVQTRTFTENLGTIPVGTPLVFDAAVGNAGQVRPWLDADTALPIIGFVYPRDVVTDASNEVLGTVMMKGRISIEDILVASTQTDATLIAQLKKPEVRYAGLHIEGLAETL